MKNANIKIAPSILSADFSRMGEEVQSLEQCGADIVHCDVMDGVFVPNITFGIKMVADIRKRTSLPLDCHLMIVEPEKYVRKFAEAGADFITVHYEACREKTPEVLSLIKECGVKCGLAINPDANVNDILPFVNACDMVLVMSVFPGFGGQKFIESVLENVKTIKNHIEKLGKDILIEIDGGINLSTYKKAIAAGVDVLVAGNAVFSAADRAETIRLLKTL